MHKYPRTPHITGSRPQPGDQDLEVVPFELLAERHLVVEEKVDGANAGIWFEDGGRLQLQSRGHVLAGGPRERQFALFKAWAARHQEALFVALGGRYVLYGEWLYAKHTIFYDALPHYFLEFDVFDTVDGRFLATDQRRALLRGAPVSSLPVLAAGVVRSVDALRALAGPSHFKTAAWKDRLVGVCRELGLDGERALQETDASDLMEGLYVKVEEGGSVVARCKYVRQSYLGQVRQGHWQSRPIIPNQLSPGIDLFADATAVQPAPLSGTLLR